jgi:hypothetical protein
MWIDWETSELLQIDGYNMHLPNNLVPRAFIRWISANMANYAIAGGFSVGISAASEVDALIDGLPERLAGKTIEMPPSATSTLTLRPRNGLRVGLEAIFNPPEGGILPTVTSERTLAGVAFRPRGFTKAILLTDPLDIAVYDLVASGQLGRLARTAFALAANGTQLMIAWGMVKEVIASPEDKGYVDFRVNGSGFDSRAYASETNGKNYEGLDSFATLIEGKRKVLTDSLRFGVGGDHELHRFAAEWTHMVSSGLVSPEPGEGTDLENYVAKVKDWITANSLFCSIPVTIDGLETDAFVTVLGSGVDKTLFVFSIRKDEAHKGTFVPILFVDLTSGEQFTTSYNLVQSTTVGKGGSATEFTVVVNDGLIEMRRAQSN